MKLSRTSILFYTLLVCLFLGTRGDTTPEEQLRARKALLERVRRTADNQTAEVQPVLSDEPNNRIHLLLEKMRGVNTNKTFNTHIFSSAAQNAREHHVQDDIMVTSADENMLPAGVEREAELERLRIKNNQTASVEPVIQLDEPAVVTDNASTEAPELAVDPLPLDEVTILPFPEDDCDKNPECVATRSALDTMMSGFDAWLMGDDMINFPSFLVTLTKHDNLDNQLHLDIDITYELVRPRTINDQPLSLSGDRAASLLQALSQRLFSVRPRPEEKILPVEDATAASPTVARRTITVETEVLIRKIYKVLSDEQERQTLMAILSAVRHPSAANASSSSHPAAAADDKKRSVASMKESARLLSTQLKDWLSLAKTYLAVSQSTGSSDSVAHRLSDPLSAMRRIVKRDNIDTEQMLAPVLFPDNTNDMLFKIAHAVIQMIHAPVSEASVTVRIDVHRVMDTQRQLRIQPILTLSSSSLMVVSQEENMRNSKSDTAKDTAEASVEEIISVLPASSTATPNTTSNTSSSSSSSSSDDISRKRDFSDTTDTGSVEHLLESIRENLQSLSNGSASNPPRTSQRSVPVEMPSNGDIPVVKVTTLFVQRTHSSDPHPRQDRMALSRRANSSSAMKSASNGTTPAAVVKSHTTAGLSHVGDLMVLIFGSMVMPVVMMAWMPSLSSAKDPQNVKSWATLSRPLVAAEQLVYATMVLAAAAYLPLVFGITLGKYYLTVRFCFTMALFATLCGFVLFVGLHLWAALSDHHRARELLGKSKKHDHSEVEGEKDDVKDDTGREEKKMYNTAVMKRSRASSRADNSSVADTQTQPPIEPSVLHRMHGAWLVFLCLVCLTGAFFLAGFYVNGVFGDVQSADWLLSVSWMAIESSPQHTVLYTVYSAVFVILIVLVLEIIAVLVLNRVYQRAIASKDTMKVKRQLARQFAFSVTLSLYLVLVLVVLVFYREDDGNTGRVAFYNALLKYGYTALAPVIGLAAFFVQCGMRADRKRGEGQAGDEEEGGRAGEGDEEEKGNTFREYQPTEAGSGEEDQSQTPPPSSPREQPAAAEAAAAGGPVRKFSGTDSPVGGLSPTPRTNGGRPANLALQSLVSSTPDDNNPLFGPLSSTRSNRPSAFYSPGTTPRTAHPINAATPSNSQIRHSPLSILPPGKLSGTTPKRPTPSAKTPSARTPLSTARHFNWDLRASSPRAASSAPQSFAAQSPRAANSWLQERENPAEIFVVEAPVDQGPGTTTSASSAQGKPLPKPRSLENDDALLADSPPGQRGSAAPSTSSNSSRGTPLPESAVRYHTPPSIPSSVPTPTTLSGTASPLPDSAYTGQPSLPSAAVPPSVEEGDEGEDGEERVIFSDDEEGGPRLKPAEPMNLTKKKENGSPSKKENGAAQNGHGAKASAAASKGKGTPVKAAAAAVEEGEENGRSAVEDNGEEQQQPAAAALVPEDDGEQGDGGKIDVSLNNTSTASVVQSDAPETPNKSGSGTPASEKPKKKKKNKNRNKNQPTKS